jgi:beta-lactamase regulating signal transducer with metallopeptidase domain
MTILYWFNPLMWISGYRLRRDSKIACDAVALSLLGTRKRVRYGRTILRILELTQHMKFPQCAPGMTEKQQLSKRLILIRALKEKKPVWQLAGVTLLFYASLLFWTRVVEADDCIR